jgi:hypothetical protein
VADATRTGLPGVAVEEVTGAVHKEVLGVGERVRGVVPLMVMLTMG